MRVRAGVQVALVTTLIAGGSVATTSRAQAGGFFDLLSSAFDGPAPQYYQPQPYELDHAPRAGLRITVRPERPRAKKVRQARTDQGKPQNTAIDPKANPDWYLQDPTLRRGDIVVLPGQVLVFGGSKGPASPEEYTALPDSKLVSKAERERIGAMARLPAAAPAAATSGRQTVSALDVE